MTWSNAPRNSEQSYSKEYSEHALCLFIVTAWHTNPFSIVLPSRICFLTSLKRSPSFKANDQQQQYSRTKQVTTSTAHQTCLLDLEFTKTRTVTTVSVTSRFLAKWPITSRETWNLLVARYRGDGRVTVDQSVIGTGKLSLERGGDAERFLSLWGGRSYGGSA